MSIVFLWKKEGFMLVGKSKGPFSRVLWYWKTRLKGLCEEILYRCAHFDKQRFQQHLVSETKLVWMISPSHLYDNKFTTVEEITHFLTVCMSNFELIHLYDLPNLEFDKVRRWVCCWFYLWLNFDHFTVLSGKG